MTKAQYEEAKRLRDKIAVQQDVLEWLDGISPNDKLNIKFTVIDNDGRAGKSSTLENVDSDTLTTLKVAIANGNQVYEKKFSEL